MWERERNLEDEVKDMNPEDAARFLIESGFAGHPDYEKIEAKCANINGGFYQRLLAATGGQGASA